MIVSRIQISCDGDHGIDIHFPEDGAVDGAIFTYAALRREARKAGWSCKTGADFCPTCANREREPE
jgi:hypothetical protein